MPLHRIFHPNSVFTDPAEKKALSQAITDLYSGPKSRVNLPAFYVIVVFHALEPGGDFFVGGDGERAKDFVRFAVDHIAVPLPSKEALEAGKFDGFLNMYEAAIRPFIGDKGLHHEITIADSPRETWRIDDHIPPKIGSAAGKRWRDENKSSAYTEEENNS
ncbi:unnamed protein product [Tilletia controversa]|uniref:Tautomerase cis-CaaD-like domain-containing protein n=3 Tax=Tilletia TaxID=13289 RepID=A0A8X7MSK6_9BASI|nr:hypothetical protein CF336_g4222 [Tilletia laevis]KAE8197234.1 hypothetical protein CF328_g3908 [Tilletia controversa]KAE8261075.1 hypothetical protein A4X03_0g3565 [Tilletia caries]KAE8202545.1 hypothetical protein CF335_g3376 [Tilletia laevis]KAE8247237.1 hypothetical protein A4X06_0g4600 [Tilletia controversa]